MSPDTFIILTYTCFGLLLGICASILVFLLGYMYNYMRIRREMMQVEMIHPEVPQTQTPVETATAPAVVIKNPLNGRADDPTNVPV